MSTLMYMLEIYNAQVAVAWQPSPPAMWRPGTPTLQSSRLEGPLKPLNAIIL